MKKEIGKRIRGIREEKKFNQAGMAHQLGITPGAYAKIERGETDPSISRLYEIAKILKVDIQILLEEPKPDAHVKLNPGIQKQINTLFNELNLLKKEFKKIRTK